MQTFANFVTWVGTLTIVAHWLKLVSWHRTTIIVSITSVVAACCLVLAKDYMWALCWGLIAVLYLTLEAKESQRLKYKAETAALDEKLAKYEAEEGTAEAIAEEEKMDEPSDSADGSKVSP